VRVPPLTFEGRGIGFEIQVVESVLIGARFDLITALPKP
jgi:hypothetical protein